MNLKTYIDFSSADFAKLIREHLQQLYGSSSTRNHTFCLPGQDPFSAYLPSEAISVLYWQLNAAGKFAECDALAAALMSLMAERAEIIGFDALRQLFWVVGLLQRDDLLVTMVRILAGRRDDPPQKLPYFEQAASIVCGFATTPQASDAARSLLSVTNFPSKLVYDLLEFLVRDYRFLWSAAVIECADILYRDWEGWEFDETMYQRLDITADEIEECISLSEIRIGLEALLSFYGVDNAVSHYGNPLTDPIGLLLRRLLLDVDAPFGLKPEGGQVYLTSASNRQVISRWGGLWCLGRAVERALPIAA